MEKLFQKISPNEILESIQRKDPDIKCVSLICMKEDEHFGAIVGTQRPHLVAFAMIESLFQFVNEHGIDMQDIFNALKEIQNEHNSKD